MTWHMPTTVDEVLRLRADNPEAPIVAGGTFLGILVRQGLVEADDWISLQNVRELKGLGDAGDLSVGAMVTHRRLELDPKPCSASGPGSAPRSVRSPAPGCATSPPWAASSPTPTTPPTRPRCSSPPTPWPRSPASAAPAASRSRTSSSGTTPPAWRRTSSSPASSCPVPPAPLSTASCAPARRKTGRPPRSQPSSTGDTVRVVVGAVSDRPHHFPDVCAEWQPGDEDQRPRHRRGVRRPDRLHRRQPGVSRLPTPRRRRRGTASPDGGRARDDQRTTSRTRPARARRPSASTPHHRRHPLPDRRRDPR